MDESFVLSASRCTAKFGAPRTSRLNPASASGIRYERHLAKALSTLAIEHNLILESQPWFSYSRSECPVRQREFCAPDFLLYPSNQSWFLVIEAKQTFYQAAFEKLDQLYLSVVSRAYGTRVHGILICKTLIPGAPKPIDSLSQYEPSSSSVYHWPELSPLRW